MAYRILCFDGGGIRGVFSARLIANLCEDAGALHEKVDLLSGSSVGSTNALALALGINPAHMIDIYEKHAATIFPVRKRRGWFKAVYNADDQRRGHLEGLAEAGVDHPERVTLGDLKRHVVITTFQLNGAGTEEGVWRAKMFHNYERDHRGCPNPDRKELVIDVLLRSSAAPILFPVRQGYADGALVANNPSVCALAEAVNPETGGIALSDIRLLSIGSGSGASLSLDVQDADWGIAQWGLKVGIHGDRLIDALSYVPAYQAQQFLGDRFLRLNPPIPPDSSCDLVSDIPRLVAAADAMRQTAEWQKVVDWTRQVWLAD